MPEKEIVMDLCKGEGVLSFLREHIHENIFDDDGEWVGTEVSMASQDFSLYHIKELTFEEKAPRREAMENILGTFRGMRGISFIYLILGDEGRVNFYFGVARDKSYNEPPDFDVVDLGPDILAPAIRGNFRGCDIREAGGSQSGNNTKKKQILERLKSFEATGCLFGIPGAVEDNESFQGVDRLIDVMSDDSFGFMLIARPYSDAQIDELERALYDISDALSPLAKHTIQSSHSSGRNKHDGLSHSFSKQSGDSVQHNHTNTSSTTHNKAFDHRSDESNQSQSSTHKSANEEFGRSMNLDQSDANTKGANGSNPSTNTKGWGNSTNESHSVQSQIMDAYSYSVMKSEATNDSEADTKGDSDTRQNSLQRSFSRNKSHEESHTTTDNITRNENIEVETKEATEWLKYIDEVLLKRVDYGRGKGLFLSCVYLFADMPTTLHRLANTAMSLYSGAEGNRSSLAFSQLTEQDAVCLKMLQNMQIPAMKGQEGDYGFALTALGRDIPHARTFGGNWLSAKELSVLAGLPQKEVPGLALREEVEFGLNVSSSEEEDDAIPTEERISLGHLVQNGVKTKLPVYLDKRELNKHTFITGVTGSGKTTTCQHILTKWGWGEKERPFLVIEPAKTEYRILKDKDVLFFTPGQQDIAPFYLNPFELYPGEKITARADMLKATFTAAFEMEAAIPQILETSIYRAYEDKGWDIKTNRWHKLDENSPNGPFADGVYAFPTLSDFLEAIKNVTEAEGFDARLKNDYIGSIKARVESLMVGAKGMMLNTVRSVDFGDLIDRHVVIELEEIKSGEEKTLLMGFILTNLMQAIKARHRQDKDFRHITLVEEAHRLLSRYEPGDSMSKKQGVGVFADMLAEVRKYGESLIIADQIPEKMTPEVLKNTNTKIVHKLFAKDDKESIGDTIALSDDQKAFLSKLPTGRAIILSQGWGKAVQVQVEPITDTSQQEVNAEEIRSIAEAYYADDRVWRRGVLKGAEHINEAPSPKLAHDYLWLLQNCGDLLKDYCSLVCADVPIAEERFHDFINEIKYIEQNVSKHLWHTYLFCNAYEEYDDFRLDVFKGILSEVADGKLNRDGFYADSRYLRHLKIRRR